MTDEPEDIIPKAPLEEEQKVGYKKPPAEHQFKRGEGGRPKGARNKLTEDFIAALQKDFEEHGEVAVQACRMSKPSDYLKIIATVIPKEIQLTDERKYTDEQLKQRFITVAKLLGLDVRWAESFGSRNAAVDGGDSTPLLN